MECSKSVDNGNETEELLAKSKETEKESKPKKWKDILLVVVILAAQFVSLCADTVLYPFFPLEAKRKGLTDTQIGLVFSSFELSRFLTAIAVGHLVGKFSPKGWCLIGSAATTLGCISFGLVTYASNTAFLPLCILIRWVAGFGSSALAVAGTTIMLKATSFEASTIVGIVEMMQGAAFASGPSLGAALYELGGYTLMFWTTGSVMAVMSIIEVFIVPQIVLDEKSTAKGNILYLLKVPGIVVLYMHFFIYTIMASARQTGIGEFIRNEFHKPSSTIGLLFGVWSICYISACAIIPSIVSKGYIFRCAVLAWIVVVISYMLMGPSPLLDFIFNGKSYFLATVLFISLVQIMEAGIYIPPFEATINLAVVNGLPRDSIQTYGSVTGLVDSACALGSMVGPLLAGAITETLGFKWTVTVLAFIGTSMLTLLVIYLLVMKITKQPLTLGEVTNHRENTDPTDAVNQIAEKLEHCFADSMKLGTSLEVVQPKRDM